MKKLLLAGMMAYATATAAQTREDYNVALNKFQLFYNSEQTDNIYGMLSERSKTLMPADKTAETFKKLHGQLGNIKGYEFTKEKDGVSLYKATFDKAVLTILLSLDKTNHLESFRFVPYQPEVVADDKTAIVLKSATGDIHGTITIPEGDKPVPVVLVIAGSGPTDRDGNSTAGVSANSYKILADSLLQAGIACVRYDKRGVARSTGAATSEENMRFENYVDDAAGFIKMLKADKRFSKVYVLGHSEGSLVGILAVNKEPVAGFISVAGIAERIDKIIAKQLSSLSPAIVKKAADMFDSLRNGQTVYNTEPALENLFHASLQPYMRSWLKYEPKEEIKKISAPILIVQGTTDIQVGEDEANKLKDANPRAKLAIIKGMNHTLKNAPMDREKNLATYADPGLPLCPGLMQPLVRFIKMPPQPGQK